MDSLIVYFSHTGNTKKVAEIFSTQLAKKGTVEVSRLIPKNPITNFFFQCRAARKKERTLLFEDFKTDLNKFDLIVIASPVWAFNVTPAINSYLDKIKSFAGKNVILLLVSSGKMFIDNCFARMEAVLVKKNAGKIFRINVNDKQLQKNTELIEALNNVLSQL